MYRSQASYMLREISGLIRIEIFKKFADIFGLEMEVQRSRPDMRFGGEGY